MKTETLFARVTPELAKKVQDEAARVGESDAYVLREALREYFARRDAGPAIINDPVSSPLTPAEKEIVGIVEAHYGKKPKKKKRASGGPTSK